MGPHRADIVGADGNVIELQHSSISSEEIRVREAFYFKLIWLLDGSSFEENFLTRDHEDYVGFRWKHPRKCWLFAQRPLFIDFNGQILGVGALREYEDEEENWWGKMVPKTKVGGWGHWWTKEEFSQEFISV